MALTGKQARHLRSLGHHLDPVVMLGKHGVTDAVIAQVAEAIAHHELIKVRIQPECPVDRGDAGEQLAAAVGAEVAQALGRTLLLWKRNPQRAQIELPNARGELRSTARQDTSKGKLPPSRAHGSGEKAPEEAKPRRVAPGERPKPAGPKRVSRPRGDEAGPKRVSRPQGEEVGPKRVSRPRGEEVGPKRVSRPRGDGEVRAPSRARTARSGGAGARPTSGARRSGPRRAR